MTQSERIILVIEGTSDIEKLTAPIRELCCKKYGPCKFLSYRLADMPSAQAVKSLCKAFPGAPVLILALPPLSLVLNGEKNEQPDIEVVQPQDADNRQSPELRRVLGVDLRLESTS